MAGSPLLIAHRGGAGLAPENTLAAFENAVHNWGADMLEMDVRSTSDGVVMVIESGKLRRQVAIRAKQELQDAGARILGVVLNKRKYHIPNWLYKRL
jgi:glycerophosphoryl diester phosphodiesterase